MPDVNEAGRVFIRESTQLPEALQLESESYMPGWRLVKNLDGHGLARKLQEMGWTFSFLAGEINVTVFGLDERKTVRRAVGRILANPRSEKFNSLEITRAASTASKRFPEVIYLTLCAHSRHIQESMFLFQANDLPARERAKAVAA